MFISVPEAIKCLEDLPTPDAIADELISLGITAEPGCPEACALAAYFELTTGKRSSVGIRTNMGSLEVIGAVLHARDHRVSDFGDEPYLQNFDLSQKLGQFARNFDGCQYPKMIKVGQSWSG